MIEAKILTITKDGKKETGGIINAGGNAHEMTLETVEFIAHVAERLRDEGCLEYSHEEFIDDLAEQAKVLLRSK